MDFIDKIGAGQVVPVLAITLGALVGIIAIISGCLTSNARIKHDAELRKNMLDRGMSAAEVEIAMRGFGSSAQTQISVEEALHYDGELARGLAASEYSPETIETILRGFRTLPANEKESVYTAIQSMVDEESSEERLLAAAKGLCRIMEPKPAFSSGEMLVDR